VPFVYHDSCAFCCGRYLRRRRDRHSGEQMADSEALVLRLRCAQRLLSGLRHMVKITCAIDFSLITADTWSRPAFRSITIGI
jgi:hypothetical protein